jgi:hypothetical protein
MSAKVPPHSRRTFLAASAAAVAAATAGSISLFSGRSAQARKQALAAV